MNVAAERFSSGSRARELRRRVGRAPFAAGRPLFVVAMFALAVGVLSGCTHTDKYPDGSLKARGPIHWMSGKQEGRWTHFHPNGAVRSEGDYLEDLQVGSWTYYFPTGAKEMAGPYAEHRRVGQWEYYHRPRSSSDPLQLSGQGRFHRGYQDGEWIFWDRGGHPIQRGSFDRGKQTLEWEYFYPGGKSKASGIYFDGARVGVWKLWNRKGEMAEKDFGFPDGVELVRETWPDSDVTRRVGFRKEGSKVGRWTARHPSGELRFVGNFVNGDPDGVWTVYDLEGKPVTSGPVVGGRPTGQWESFGGFPWEPSRDRPGQAPYMGEWLPPEEIDLVDMQSLVETYLSEVASPVGHDDIFVIARTTDVEASGDAFSSATNVAAVPTPDVPWTKADRDARKVTPDLYGDSPPVVADSRYGLAPNRSGNTKKSRPMEDRQLPLTRFERAEGGTLDLGEFRGKRPVLLIVLRGFAQRVCVYCFEQMIAYKRSKLLDEWRDEVEILVVYPGPREGLAEFRRKFEQEPDRLIPDFPVLYDPNLELTRALDIEDEQALPTTMIIDQAGVVRWAYVGQSIEDRPSAKRVSKELKKVLGRAAASR
ncbi:MAG: redoxin family protein [Planctomycetota bacterium]